MTQMAYISEAAGQFLPIEVVRELVANPAASLAMDEKPTYNAAIEVLTKVCNMTQLGCLFYGVDYDNATASEKENARSKIRNKLRKPTPKTIARLNEVLFPFVYLISDQQLKKLTEIGNKFIK